MSEIIVLDASAVLALLGEEPGSGTVLAAMQASRAVMSAVNAAEVHGKLCDAGVPSDVADEVIGSMAVDIVDFDAAQARRAGRLRAATRMLGLSLGDRACLSLAQQLRAPALTADKAWSAVQADVAVHVIR